MAIAAGDRGNIAGFVDDLIGHVDGIEYRAKVKAVRRVVLVMIAHAAAQRQQQKQRDFVGVVMKPDAPISAAHPMAPI